MPHAEMVDVRSGSARGAVSTAATTNRRWTRSLPPCVTIGFGGMSMGANAAPSDSAMREPRNVRRQRRDVDRVDANERR